MTLAEDTILENRYRIDGLLARGGIGAIYRAFDLNLNTPVAIKENSFPTPERMAQFKQEALILASLRHPALPRVIHHFSADGKQYLVMDFIEGENLWEIVQRQGQPLAEDTALDYVIQVCRAVSYLHQQTPPIIHRDIKPQNIKITPQGQAVLVDFGIAKQITDEKSATLAGAQGIAPGFSSPEQYRQPRITPVSDIYSLGASLYAVLTGQTPPDSLSLVSGKSKLNPPEKLNKKLSPQVSKAISQAMQVDPAKRPPSVAAWQQELEAIAQKSTKSADEKEITAPGTTTLAQDRTAPVASSSPAAAGATYWLVDATGWGYPVGAELLVIGRQAEADVVLEDLSVARSHARIRVKSGRCLVIDDGSANGTFINDRRLGTEWYPLNPGDMLTVGSVRFYLTATQPAKLAAEKPAPAAAEQTSGMTASPPSPPIETSASQQRSRKWLLFGAVVLILLLGIAGYWLVDPAAFSGLTGAPPLGPAATDSQTVSTVTSNEPASAQADEVEGTVQRREEPTATIASLAATVTPTSVTADTPSENATVSPAPTLVSKNKDTLIRTATSTLVSSTFTPTPTIAATVTRTRIAAVEVGPTVIPLEIDGSIPELGTQEVIDVDFNPKNPQEIYALVKGDGIYRSSNGGDGPWAKMKLDASGLVALVIDPTDPTRLYGPTWNAVLKSTDGGNTWAANTTGLISNRAVDVLTIHPTRPDTLYGGVGETLVVSTDGGASWSSLGYGNGLGVVRFYQIVVDSFKPDTVYVAGQGAAIYKSEDGGRNFLPMPYDTGEGSYGLAAHPTQKDVYLAGLNSPQAAIVKTENGWDFESVSTGLIYGGADSAYAAITYAPSNPNIVYAGSGYESNPDAKGIFKSTDGGQTWSNISYGLRINKDTSFPYYVKSIAVHPTNPDILFVATGSGLYQSIEGGANWKLK